MPKLNETPQESKLLTLTAELESALVRAYYCCREVGSRNWSAYELEANQAAERIAVALRGLGTNL